MSDDLTYSTSDALFAVATDTPHWRWEWVTHGIDDPHLAVEAPNGQRFIAVMEYDEQDLA